MAEIAGAIDVGSNALRATVGALDPAGALECRESLRAPVRLGHDTFTDGVIRPETIKRAIDGFKLFRELFDRHNVSRYRAVGTSALRESSNGAEVVHAISSATGLQIELISGEEEGRLVYNAVSSKLDLTQGRSLLVEIGGGSVELSIVDEGSLSHSFCLPLGTVRLLRLLDGNKLSPKVFYRMVRDYAKGADKLLLAELSGRPARALVGTGGNIEELAELAVKLFKAKSTDRISVEHLSDIVDRLQQLSVDERSKEFGLRPDRADVILPAGIVFLQIARQIGVSSLSVPRVGVRDGLLLDLLREQNGDTAPTRRNAVFSYGLEIGRRYGFEEAHGRAVARHAVSLFDQTKELHELELRFRTILEVAALLHDIGQVVSYQSHHKHSYYLLKETPFVGLTPREQRLVAAIARYHRKSPPKEDHEAFAAVDSADRPALKKLAALIRIADALDRQHTEAVSSFQVLIDGATVRLRLNGEGDLLLEQWALKEKSKLFTTVFGKDLIAEVLAP